MLANMSEIDPRAGMPPLDWSDAGMNEAINEPLGTRLFISPRTVQTHLTHIYAKLGLSSRLQLIQHAARHA